MSPQEKPSPQVKPSSQEKPNPRPRWSPREGGPTAPRRRKVKVPFLVRYRTPLLLGMLTLIAAVIGLLLFGRAGMTPVEPDLAEGEADLTTPAEEGVTSRSEGFDYTQYEEGKPLFRVQGATQSMGRDDSARLEDVEIQLFRPEGDPYLAHSERALYRRQESAAELEGNVRLEGANGLKLWTEKLTVGKEGQRVVSPVPVRFEYGRRISGEANRLRMEIPAQLVLLQGKVRLTGREGGESFRLTADRGFFEEANRLLRAEGDVRITHGEDFLIAQRLSAYLEQDRDTLRFVRAKWKVGGRLHPAGRRGGDSSVGSLSGPLDFTGDAASLLLDPTGQQVRKIELEGSERFSAEMRVPEPAFDTIRRLTANYIVGDFAADSLGSVQAFGQVTLAELPRSSPVKLTERKPLRQVRSERAEATLNKEGALDLMTLHGAVEYEEPEFRVESHRARFNFSEGLAQFLGGPARLVGEEGDVVAQQIVYNQKLDHLIAGGGARLTLPQGKGIPGPLMSSGDGPVRVEAKEARFNREADRTVFTGDVRAWRGRDLILAQEMIVQRKTERLEASGAVRTIWHPEPPASGVSAFESEVLEVSAEEFSYLGDESLLRYRGKVEVLDGQRILRCGRTEIHLDENDEMKRLECLETAYINDRAEGRVIEGERAIHDPAAGEIRVWGKPVKLRDRRGSQVEGELVIYDLKDKTVEIGKAQGEGAQPEAAPREKARDGEASP